MASTKLINVLIFLSMVLAAVFFIWYLIGNSPAIEHILTVIILPLYLFGFGLYKNLNDKITYIGERLARIEGKLNI